MVARALGVREHLPQASLCPGRVVVEAKLELGVGQLQLARIGLADVAAGLQVLHGDAQLRGEHAKGLDGRRPRTRLDAGDIGVGDAGGREIALREASFQPEPFQARTDCLRELPLCLDRHSHWNLGCRTIHKSMGLSGPV